jgi:hypothetical protein
MYGDLELTNAWLLNRPPFLDEVSRGSTEGAGVS